ncbi:MAG: DUF1611 domain-containing protein [Synechococcus sp.]
MLTAEHRVVLLQHGGLDHLRGKTGLAMLRHRPGPIVAVVDPDHAGCRLDQVTGIQRAVPVVADLEAALAFDPEVAVVGLAPSGGQLPPAMRRDVRAALQAGLHLASGLHTRLADDQEFAAARCPDRWIWDLRQEPPGLSVGQAAAAALTCRRILAVGTDMAVGKMSACLELLAAAERGRRRARFVGTGQAGILIAGEGVALDAVRVDYAAGAVEAAVLRAGAGLAASDLVLIEGQGSLCHPASTATLPLMRGSQPTDLLLVHRAEQQSLDRVPEIPLPPLDELIAVTEALAALARPQGSGPAPGVRGVALNTARLCETEAQAAVQDLEQRLQLPCSDPVRWGGDDLLKAIPS